LRFFQLVLVLVLCVGGALVGFFIGPENAHPICCLVSLSDCAINRVCFGLFLFFAPLKLNG
jgi:hypothetical protein